MKENEMNSMITAPRDGTSILLKTVGGWVEARFFEGEFTENYEYGAEYSGDAWVTLDGDSEFEVEMTRLPDGTKKYNDHGVEGWLPLSVLEK